MRSGPANALEMPATLQLPPRLDLAHIAPAAEALRENLGRDLMLDAGQVTHLGALGLQLLIASAQSWRAAGLTLRIEPRSDAFDSALQCFGVPLRDLQTGEITCH